MTAYSDELRQYAEQTRDLYKADCPVRRALDRLGDKWTTLIIGLLAEGPKRFSELKRGIGGISQKMLAQTLRSLERDGLVSRTQYLEMPPRVEYALTPLGLTLCEPLMAIMRWTEAHIDQVTAAQQSFDARMGGYIRATPDAET